jgi:two-component sensor histidine kinase
LRAISLRLAIFFCFYCAVTNSASGYQSLRYVSTSLERSVGKSSVQAVEFDAIDRAWVGTQAGLLTFDGVESSFGANDMKAPWTSDVIAMAALASGAIVVLTHSDGLFVTEDGLSFRRIRFKGSFSEAQARSLRATTRGGVWVGYRRHLAYLPESAIMDPESNVSLRSVSPAITSNLAILSEQTACFGSLNSIRCLNEDFTPEVFIEMINETPSCSGEPSFLLVSHSRETLIAGTRNGAILSLGITDSTDRQCIQPTILRGRAITALEKTSYGYLIGTDDGLFESSRTFGEVSRLSTGIHSSISGIFRQNDLFWITSETGISLVTYSPIQIWPDDSVTNKFNVTSLTEMEHKELFFTTYTNIFSSTFQVTSPDVYRIAGPESQPGKLMSSALYSGRLFVGTLDSGLFEYEISDDRTLVQLNHYLPGAGITRLQSTDTHLLIGTFESGLQLLGPSGVSAAPSSLIDAPLNQTPITSIEINHGDDTDAVLTTESSVFRLCLSPTPKICRSIVVGGDEGFRFLSSYIMSPKNILLGTLNDGLLMATRKKISDAFEISTVEPQPAKVRSIYKIIAANSDSVHLSTNNGIWAWSTKSGFRRVASERDGIPYPDFNHGAGIRSSSGRSYFGSAFGLVAFESNSPTNTDNDTRIFLRSVTIGDGSTVRDNSIRNVVGSLFSYKDLPLTFSFSVNDFRSTYSVAYDHYLEGYEKTWISSGNQNKVTYTSLPPGEYVFRARGADSSGTWSTNEISFPVTVLPPWYQTWPAYCAYALAAGLMLVLLKRANETHTLREAAAELEQEIRLAHERELDDLQDHVDSTEVLAHQANTDSNQLIEAFEALIDAVDRASGEGGASSASRIDCLTERIENLKLLRSLQSTDALAAGVNLSEYADVLLEQLVAERGDHYSDIIFVNDIDGQPIPFGRAVSIGCILRELIVNALDHGHAAPVSGSIISIRLPAPVFDDNGRLSFTIVVEDNGKGDAAGFSALNGLGLRLVGAITERLHGSFTIEDIGGARATVIVTFDEIRH